MHISLISRRNMEKDSLGVNRPRRFNDQGAYWTGVEDASKRNITVKSMDNQESTSKHMTS
jgi:hypothetical protein